MVRSQVSEGSSAEIAAWRFQLPVLGTTRYDRISAMMVAVLFAVWLVAAWSFAVWLSNLRAQVASTNFDPWVGTILLADADNEDDVTPLDVESPADPSKDPSVVDADNSEPSVEQTIDQILKESPEASRQFVRMPGTDPKRGGLKGSRDGSKRGPLSETIGIACRLAPHERWFIRFSDRGSLETYAAQLDHFNVELGLYQDKKFTVLSNLSADRAVQTTITSGKDKPGVMPFTWAGGRRKQADVNMIKTKAGIDVTTGIILHLYPQETVQLLAAAELAASKRPVEDIIKTYFTIVTTPQGIRIVVVKIKYRD